MGEIHCGGCENTIRTALSRLEGVRSVQPDHRLACEQLCEEPQPWRRRPPGLGLQELMRCAAHLAAILEFCGGGILTTSLEPIAGAPSGWLTRPTSGPRPWPRMRCHG